MFKYPYETTPGANYVLKDIMSALQRAMIDGELRTAQTLKNTPVEGLREVPPYLKAVPPFSHPIAIDHFGKTIIVIDTRPFVRETRDGQKKITSSTEYQFMVLRGLLSMRWAEDGPADFGSMGDITARAFIRLLSEGIVRRLGLSPIDQQALAAVTGFYYYSLFFSGGYDRTDRKIEERELLKMATRISRVTMIPIEKVLEIIEPLGLITDIFAYCNAVKQGVNSSRLEQFNPGLLYAIVGGCWFGAAAREVVAVSLEYPPTFFAMTYMALTDRSYHGAYFTKLVEAVNKGNSGKEFITNLIAYSEVPSNV